MSNRGSLRALELEIDPKVREHWENEGDEGAPTDWIFMKYFDPKAKRLNYLSHGNGGLKEGIENFESGSDEISFLVVKDYDEVPEDVIEPFHVIVFYIPELVREKKIVLRFRACWHISSIAKSIGLDDYYVLETVDPSMLSKFVVQRAIIDSRKKTKTAKISSSFKRIKEQLHVFTHSSKLTLFESMLLKEGGGRFLSYSLKKRYHKLTSDLMISYYGKSEQKGTYSVKDTVFGRGSPPRKAQLKKKKNIGSVIYKFGKKNEKEIDDGDAYNIFYIETENRTYRLQSDDPLLAEGWLTVLKCLGCQRKDYFKADPAHLQKLKEENFKRFQEVKEKQEKD